MGDGAVCLNIPIEGFMEKESPSKTELKRDHQCVADDAEAELFPSKRRVKEDDDLRSEVSNPGISSKENQSSSLDITSQPDELVGGQVECGDLVSACSGNSSSDETLSVRDRSGNGTSRNHVSDTSGAVHVSQFVLEIPKHVSSTGIRKITFKFSKRKEDYGNQPSSLGARVAMDGLGNIQSSGSSDGEPGIEPSSTGDGYTYPEGDAETCKFHSCAPNMELKMSKKVFPSNYPTNVKKLLSTGILDGARVKYISTTGKIELQGIINGGGYMCGCSLCNFSSVLSAYEFEQHAGVKTRHPNNHIYLENGRPIYSVIQEIKTAPVSILDEVIKDVAGSSVNMDLFATWKAKILQNKSRGDEENNNIELCRPPSSFTSYSSQALEQSSGSISCFDDPVKQKMLMAVEVQKHGAKKSSPYLSKLLMQPKKSAEGGTKRRDNDLHRLLFLPNGLPDGAELAYFVKGQRILCGYKQGNGIVCSHCDREVSPSQFEAHAGMAARRQPYRHIYTTNGITLHDIAISLANGQKITTGDSDDMCATCGDGGDLMFCNGCPRAFHAACLHLQCIPEGEWCCPNCKDKVGLSRKTAIGESPSFAKSIVIRLTRVVKAPDFEIGGCVVCRGHDFSVAKFDEQTVMICDQCEREFHVGCLHSSGLCQLTELPKDKWFCCGDCNRIHVALQNIVLNGAETIPASLSNIIIGKHVDRGILTDEVNDVEWRVLSGKSRFPGDLPLLSRAVAMFRECFDPIVATSGRDLIPVMVYGRNISGQEFGGMYCVVLTVRSVVVSAGLLRIFGQQVAELPIVATSREHQGKGYFQVLFSCIEMLLRSLNVENLVLPAAEEAESIWTKKLGFRRMTEEQLKKYLREVQLTMFKGTSMLEKVVQRTEERPQEGC